MRTRNLFHLGNTLMKQKVLSCLNAGKIVLFGVSLCYIMGACQEESVYEKPETVDTPSSRASDEKGIFITPPILDMKAGKDGAFDIKFSGPSVLNIKLDVDLADYNIEPFIMRVPVSPYTIPIKWNSKGAPATGFTVPIRFTGSGFPDQVVYVRYVPGTIDPPPGGEVGTAEILPTDTIPDGGGIYKCSFTGGSYTGVVNFRALKGDSIFLGTSGLLSDTLDVFVPEAKNNKDVVFEYSIDGAATWVKIETRKQLFETLGSGSIIFEDSKQGDIPVGGTVATLPFSGTFSGEILMEARVNNVMIASGSGYVNGKVQVTVPPNTTGRRRIVSFAYSLNKGITWKAGGYAYQLAK